MKAVNDALPKMKDGLREFGILPLDPLAVNSLSISEGADRPVNLKQEFRNIKILHVTDSTVKMYKTDINKLILRSEVFTPSLEFLADYTISGRILILPVTGNGKSNITMTNVTTKHELFGEPIMKKGELYMKLKEYKVTFSPERVYMNFENLFNGDKILADNMNAFLNENWEIVFNELKSGYEDTFGLVFKDITNKLFTKIPLRTIFLQD